MHAVSFISVAALGLGLGAFASAQDSPLLSEIRVTQAGPDGQDFVEVEALPGSALDGLVLVAVDGRPGTAGTLDVAIDLTGNVVDPSGLFVVGGANVMNVDLAVPEFNVLRNGPQTIYLILASDVAAVLALEGTDVDPDGDLVTTIPQLGTILDHVGLVEGGPTAMQGVVFDGALALGPTGNLLPPGVFRSDAAGRAWCTRFLEYDANDLSDPYAHTPGSLNPPCPFGESYLVPPGGAGFLYDRFGEALDVSDATAIVGAPEAPPNGSAVGSAYIFDIPSAALIHELQPRDGQDGDLFGHSVAIDGPWAVVGAPGHPIGSIATGAAYVFDAATGEQVFQLFPDAADAPKEFGYSVALEGNLALVGAPRDQDVGAVYVFDMTTGAQRWKLTPTAAVLEADFGYAIDLDGDRAVVGAPSSSELGQLVGAAYLFDLSTGIQTAKLQPQDLQPLEHFGLDVAIDAGRTVVGSTSHRGFVFDSGTGAPQGPFEVPGSQDLDFFRNLDLAGSQVLLGGPTSQEPRVLLYDLETGAVTDWLPHGVRAGEGVGYYVRLGERFTLISAALEVNLHGEHAGSVFALEFAIGERTCASTPNSSGTAARIEASGSTSVLANDLVLRTVNMPPSQPGLHFYGSHAVMLPFGNGFRCVGGLVARLPATSSDSAGVLEQVLDNTDPPTAATMITAGSTWHFQAWFRDPLGGAAQFDLSDALSIPFRL